MEQNVKKKSAHHIYYGIAKESGELKHITEVQGGVKCGCICAACGEPLEARKGSVRKHHFAHISNYECLYTCEVAIYRAVADILKQERQLWVPPIELQFPTWDSTEPLKPEQTLELQTVDYSCEKLQYPPTLKVEVKGQGLKILIEFGTYYSAEDLKMFEQESVKGNYSTMLLHFPNIEQEDFFEPEQLKRVLMSHKSKAKWIRSASVDMWRRRYLAKSVTPQRLGDGYACPILEGSYQDGKKASGTDCARCWYNVGKPPECLCIGATGITKHEDFYVDPMVLKKRMEERLNSKKRAIEEKKRREQEEKRRAQEARRQERQMNGMVAQHSTNGRCDLPEEHQASSTELLEEQQRIVASFKPDSAEWTVDKYGRRWIKCERCGQIKEDSEMSDYGGRRGLNLGICSECVREAHGKRPGN